MSDLGDVTARLVELSDAEIASAVHRATTNRPALVALRAAAEVVINALPAPEPDIPAAPEVGPPVSFSVSDRVRDKVERQDKLEEIRESLRRTIRPER